MYSMSNKSCSLLYCESLYTKWTCWSVTARRQGRNEKIWNFPYFSLLFLLSLVIHLFPSLKDLENGGGVVGEASLPNPNFLHYAYIGIYSL